MTTEQERQADEQRLEEEKRKLAQRRQEEEEKIEAQVATLPDWKRKLLRAKLMAKLDSELPHPDSLTIDSLPPINRDTAEPSAESQVGLLQISILPTGRVSGRVGK